MDDMTRCELLKTISEYQFVAVELNLYLDTHPGDAAARSDYLYYSTRLKELIAAYEEQYGPLMNFDCYGLLCLQRMALGLRRKRLNVDLSEKA